MSAAIAPYGEVEVVSFEIAGEMVPITAEYDPHGFVLGWGLTWLL